MKHIKKLIALALVAVSILGVTIPAIAAQVNANKVAVRHGPGTNYGIITRFSPGKNFDVRFKANGSSLNGSKVWYGVTWRDGWIKEGYIHGSFINDTTIMPQRPSDATDAFGVSTLKHGSKGIYVYNMQLVLYKNGYLSSLNACDGIYGAATGNALRAFQLDNVSEDYPGQPVDDGLVGPATRSALWVMRNKNGTSTDILQQYGAIVPNG